MAAPAGKLPLRAAMEARDHAAAVDAFAPDAVLVAEARVGGGRRTGRLRGRVISVLAAPLGLIIAVADRVAARLVLPALRQRR